MKKLRMVSLLGIISIALLHTGWAAPNSGGGRGFGGGFTGGGHSGSVQGGGVASRGGGVGFSRPGFNGTPAYYYSGGMYYMNGRPASMRSTIHQSPSVPKT